MNQKCVRKVFLLLFSFFTALSGLNAYGYSQPGKSAVIENNAMRLSFNAGTGALEGFSDLKNKADVIEKLDGSSSSPWEIIVDKGSISSRLNVESAGTFHVTRVNQKTITLEWSHFRELSNQSFKVTVQIKLDDHDPFSRWHIAVTGLRGEKLRAVEFPRINGLKPEKNEKLAAPAWMGTLIDHPRGSKEKPRHYSWKYPGSLSMQFCALYDESVHGLYVACDDSLNYAKQFSFRTDSLLHFGYQMTNYPPYDQDHPSYVMPYDAIVGVFRGDWISAAYIYRKWAVKQRWCREARFKNRSDDSWVEKTALWEWNRGRSDNVLTPARALKERLGLPVSVLWHWWHGCSYDDGFPEYFPPREGAASFKAAVAKADDQGIKAIVYMNSIQWGTSTKSFEKEDASRWAVRDIEGNTRAHTFNIFTHHSLTPMCMATSYWKNKYAALADKAIDQYHTGGVYMDQACTNLRCYNEAHGHSLGGGNYWVKNFGQLTQQIRAGNNTSHPAVLAGEGCAEGWLPYLDAMLTLQVSKERYAGVNGQATIPLFQAVYHPYGITFGSYSSLVTPPYDELWPKKDAPQNPEQPLPKKYNTQFLMEQARSFVWGMQPAIANYHDYLASERKDEVNYLLALAKTRYSALKFLLYGKFLRAPSMDIATRQIDISRLSIYAGQKNRVTNFTEQVPLLYTGAWKADDGSLGIPLASIDTHPMKVRFTVNASEYHLPPAGKVYIIDATGKKLLQPYKDGKIEIDYTLPSMGICLLEIG